MFKSIKDQTDEVLLVKLRAVTRSKAISSTHIFYVYVTLALADSIRGVSHLRNLSHLSICWREKVVQDDKALDNVAVGVSLRTFRGD